MVTGYYDVNELMECNMWLIHLCVICRSVPDSYTAQLVEDGVMKQDEATKITADHMAFLTEQFKLVDSTVPKVIIFMPSPFLIIHIPNIIEKFLHIIYLCFFNCSGGKNLFSSLDSF